MQSPCFHKGIQLTFFGFTLKSWLEELFNKSSVELATRKDIHTKPYMAVKSYPKRFVL